MGKATIKDVAERAGVSSATVSHVINKTRFVSDETKERVQRAIEELAYSPNVTARNFRMGKNNTIGVIIPDISNSYFATIVEELEAVISRKKYNLIVSNTKETKGKELSYVRLLTSGLVDGLVIASTCKSFSELQDVLPDGFPVVFIDRTLADNTRYDTVCMQDAEIVKRGIEQLIAAGHTRIGYIAGLRRLSTTVDRLRAYQDVMTQHQIYCEGKLVRYADSMANSAYHCAQELIEQNCTALVISNNIMTNDALRCIYKAGLQPGKDIDVFGYGYNDWRNYIPQNIRLIIQPDRELGQLAGNRILACIKELPKYPEVFSLVGKLNNEVLEKCTNV